MCGHRSIPVRSTGSGVEGKMTSIDPNTGQTLYSTYELEAAAKVSTESGELSHQYQTVRTAYEAQTAEQTAYAEQQRMAQIEAEVYQLRNAPNLHSDEGRWEHYVDLVRQYDAATPGDQSYLIEGAIQHSGVTSADIAREQYGSALTSQKAASGDAAAQAMVSSGAWQPGTQAAEKAASDIGIIAVPQAPVVLQGPVVVNTNPEVPIGTVSQITGNVWTGTGWGSQEHFYGDIISNANRPGYTPIHTLGDITTQDLIFGYGYSPLQATIIQAAIASNKFDATATRFYGNEAQKAFQDVVEISSGYHAWAKQTGLPQAPNPYEYAGDLALAVLKGTNEKSKSSVYGEAPINTSILNLPNGQGLQDVAWNAAVGYDRSGKYSVDYSKFLVASDVVTEAIISGNMGPYAALGKPYSSEYETLSLAQQQEIATGVARAQGYAVHPEVPMPDYSFDWSVMGGTALYTGALAEAHATETGTMLQEPSASMNVPIVITRPSEEWVQGIPVIGGMLAYAGISPKLSELRGIPYIYETAAWISPKEIETTTRGTPYNANISDIYRRSAGADYTMQYLTPEGEFSDVYGTITPTTRSITSGKSAFDEWQADIARQTGLSSIPVPTSEQISAGGRLMQMYNPAIGIYSQTPIGQHTISSNVEEVTQRPVSFAGEVGVSALLGGTFRAGEEVYAVGRAATAEKVISEGGLWRLASSASGVAVEYAPKALTALYGVDVAGRATLWGSDFSQAQERTGDILGRETIPMGIGFVAGYRSPELARGAYDTAKITSENIGERTFEFRQNLGGIQRVQPGTLTGESVPFTEIYEMPRAPSFNNEAGAFNFQGVRRAAPGAKPEFAEPPETIDLRETIDLTKMESPKTTSASDLNQAYMEQFNLETNLRENYLSKSMQEMLIEKYSIPENIVSYARANQLETGEVINLASSLKSMNTPLLATASTVTVAGLLEAPATAQSSVESVGLISMEEVVSFQTPSLELASMQKESSKSMQAELYSNTPIIGSNLVRMLSSRSDTQNDALSKMMSVQDEVSRISERSDESTIVGSESALQDLTSVFVTPVLDTASITQSGISSRSLVDFTPQVINQLYWYNLPRPVIPNAELPRFPIGGIGFGGSTPSLIGPGWPRPRKRNYENPVVDIDYLSRMNAPFANTQRRSSRKVKKSKR